ADRAACAVRPHDPPARAAARPRRAPGVAATGARLLPLLRAACPPRHDAHPRGAGGGWARTPAAGDLLRSPRRLRRGGQVGPADGVSRRRGGGGAAAGGVGGAARAAPRRRGSGPGMSEGPTASLNRGRVALVLPGGGARGAYEVGALSVLLPALEARGE